MLRNTIFSVSWWISTFLSTLVIMCFIVLIKKVTANVPVLNEVAAQV